MQKFVLQKKDATQKLEQQKDESSVIDDPVLVANHRKREQKWFYTTQKPADDWSAVDFRAKEAKWKLGIAPLEGLYLTRKENDMEHVRYLVTDKFSNPTSIPKALRMQVYFYDEDAEIYLNGQEIASTKGFVTKYVDVPLDQKALSALQTGRNVVSVHVHNKGGGQFFEAWRLRFHRLLPSILQN